MSRDLGLLLVRVAVGCMMAVGHGFGKVKAFVSGDIQFPDPIGIGPAASLALAGFAEFLCSLAVAAGLKTRWTAVPVVITMLVAAFVHHADDPWGKKELALLYAVSFLALVFAGGGRFAADALLENRARKKKG